LDSQSRPGDGKCKLKNSAARTTNSTLLSKEKATTRGRREERTEAEEEEDEEGEKAGGGSWFSPEQRLPLGGGRGLTSGWDGAGAAVIIHTLGPFWQLCPISVRRACRGRSMHVTPHLGSLPPPTPREALTSFSLVSNLIENSTGAAIPQ